MLKISKLVAFIFLLTFSLFSFSALAQEEPLNNSDTGSIQTEPVQETMKGFILEIVDQGSQEVYGREQKYIVYKVRITEGSGSVRKRTKIYSL